MKISTYSTSLFLIILSITLVYGEVHTEDEISGSSSTTEKSELQSSLNRIISKVQSIQKRVSQTLNQTAESYEKSLHDLAIEDGYKHDAKLGYYKLYTQKLSWYDALTFCRKVKAHLPFIASAEEKSLLDTLIKDKLKPLEIINPSESGDLVAYVGLHDYGKKWLSSHTFEILEDVEYVSWGRKAVLHYTGPQCAAIDTTGLLNSFPCKSKQYFVCQKDSLSYRKAKD